MKKNEFGFSRYMGKKRKLLLIMKLTFLLTVVCFLQVSATVYSQATKFSFELKNQRIQDVLREIEKNSEFRFFYQREQVDVEQIVTLNITDKTVEEILPGLFEGQEVVFDVRQDNLILIKPEKGLNLSSTEFYAQQQQKTVSGKVTDAATREALPGVNIVVSGTTTGTSTDINGVYILEVPNATISLQFSFIGYINQQITLGGNNTINVALVREVAELGEIVITALGFKEDRDKVGSSSSKIDSKSINNSGETGLLNKMAGKASGVVIGKSSGSDPGGGSFVQIRGASTLSGNYQPLFIIDGVPMSNSIIGGTSYDGVIQQSRVNDINPEDIASIHVLKGASASALWGSRAANGVVMITTKSGSYNEKMKISFKTTYSNDVINRYHEKQTNYGQGANGISNTTSASAWGDKIENRSGGEDVFNTTGQYFEGYQTGARYYPIIQKNSKKTFENEQYNLIFRDGYFIDNNLSFSGGGATSNYMFSISDIYQQGVIRNSSDYRRSTVRLNIESKLSDILRLSTNATYAITKSNRVQRSNNVAGMMLGYYRMPVDFDITDYKGNYYSSATASPIINRHRSYRNYMGSTNNPIYNNPLWTMYEQLNPNTVNRFILSSEIAITPLKWFEFITRLGLDNYLDKRETYFPVYSADNLNGSYNEQNISENQINWDIIGRAKHNFGNFSTSLIVGLNFNDRKYSSLAGNMVNFLIFDGPMSFSNAQAVNKNPSNSETNIRSARMYSVLGLNAYNSVFLNLSFAGESASTFGEESNSTFYYPSADIAWQFSKLSIFENSPLLTFGKLRFAYGVTGVQPQPYRTETLFVAGSSLFGNGAFLQSSNGGNNQLRPEKKTEYEVGLDLRFLNNRVIAGITYYQNYTTDLLLSVPVPYSTGFSSFYQNIGAMENKGIEIDFGYDILKKDDLLVNLNANFSQNRNIVTDLADASRVFLGGVGGFMGQYAVEGEPVGVFMGGHYSRDEDGQILFDSNGFPLASGVNVIIGNPNPKWRGGLGAVANYKNFSLSIVFETFQGGDFYDGTRSVMYTHGTHPDIGNEVTTDRDLKNFRGVLIPAGTTVRGNVMDLGAGPVLLDESYYTTQGGGFGTLKEQFVVDGSWTRLRDVSFGYTLSSESFRRVTKLQSIEFKVSGRNLILWTGLKGVDPDLNQTQASLGRGMDYFENPGTKSYLFTVLFNY